MPVLLIVGGKDILLDSVKTADRIKKLLPHVQTVFLKDAGHGLIDQQSRIVKYFNE